MKQRLGAAERQELKTLNCHICTLEIDLNIYGGTILIDGCGKRNPLALNIDHYRPKSFAGTDEDSNLMPAHAHCNQSKNKRFVGSGSDEFCEEKKRVVSKLKEIPVEELWTKFTYCLEHPERLSIVVAEAESGSLRGFCGQCYKQNKKGSCLTCGRSENEVYMHSTTKCDSCYSKETIGTCLTCGKTEGNFKTKTKCYSCHVKGLKGICEICGISSEEAAMRTTKKCVRCDWREQFEKERKGTCTDCGAECLSVLKDAKVCKECNIIRSSKNCEACGVSSLEIKFTTKTVCKRCFIRRSRSKQYDKINCIDCGVYEHPIVKRYKLCEKCYLQKYSLKNCYECGAKKSPVGKYASSELCSSCVRNRKKNNKEIVL